MRNAVVAAVIVMALAGCSAGPEWTTPPGCPPQPLRLLRPWSRPLGPPVAVYANPIFVPVADPQCAWEQVVEVVDDYFRIEHEEPVRVVGNTLTEGTFTTVAEVSPTIFEPWRHDTVDPQQRIENTLQTMRRRAVVRVVPAQGGHWVEVQVFKELEDTRSAGASHGRRRHLPLRRYVHAHRQPGRRPADHPRLDRARPRHLAGAVHHRRSIEPLRSDADGWETMNLVEGCHAMDRSSPLDPLLCRVDGMYDGGRHVLREACGKTLYRRGHPGRTACGISGGCRRAKENSGTLF